MCWSLERVPLGQLVHIEKMILPRQERITLNAVGFSKGQPVRRIASMPWGGPVLVQLGNALVAVERPLARLITVHCSLGRKRVIMPREE